MHYSGKKTMKNQKGANEKSALARAQEVYHRRHIRHIKIIVR
jgi:1,2-phenylacetyl-CoA epoxidase PaaB subunit